MKHWMKDGRVQVIAQCELLPVLVAFRMFPEKLRGRPLLSFLDNEGARCGLIAASSAVQANAEVIAATARIEDALQVSA